MNYKSLLSFLLFGANINFLHSFDVDQSSFTDGDLEDTTNDRTADSDTSTDVTMEECADKLECSGDDLEGDYVFCEGFYGCYEADVTADITAYLDGYRGGQEADISAEEDIYCGGYVGCYMSEMIAYNDIICDGTVGCYNSIMYSYNNIYLTGYKGATACDVFGNSSDVSLYAYGSYSALYSIVNDIENIYNFGLYGLYFADIFTDDVDEFNMYNYGRYSTYYAQLYCKHGTTCNVYCRDTGCYGMEFRCMRGATCTYTLYNEEDGCDSEPTLLYAKDKSEEDEWLELFEKRKTMKTLAKKEFAVKYAKEMAVIEDEKLSDKEKASLLKHFDIETAFEEIMENVKERMDLLDGGSRQYQQKPDSMSINEIREANNNKKVIVVSDHVDSNKAFTFEWVPAIMGVISGVLVLCIVLFVKSKCASIGSRSGESVSLKTDSNGYTYQSI